MLYQTYKAVIIAIVISCAVFCGSACADDGEKQGKRYKGKTLKQWLLEMDNENYKCRQDAIIAISKIADKSAVNVLLKALHDSDEVVRSWAAEILGDLKAPEAVLPLLYIIREDYVNGVALGGDVFWEILVEKFGKAAIKDLQNELWTADNITQYIILIILGQIGDDTVVPDVILMLNNKDDSVRAAACDVLGKIKSERAIPFIICLIKNVPNKDGEAIRHAALSLVAIGSQKAVPLLLDVIENPKYQNDEVRWAYILLVLGRIGDKEVIPCMLKALEHKNSIVKSGALCVIKAIKYSDNNVIHALITTAKKEGDVGIRKQTIGVLAALRGPTDMPLLIKQLGSGEIWDDDKRVVIEQLQALSGQSFGDDPVKWREWWEANKARILKEEAEKEKAGKE